MTEREQKQLQCWIHNASILGKRCIPDTQRCHYQTMHVVEQAGVLDYDLSHVQSRRCTTGCCGMSEGLGRAPGCSVTIDVTGGPPVIDCW
ncbi:hypothetical protein ACCO45_012460 [Purpureocillium lilacinum]|uniref:Uncharacterized protein n=1 Tax=Purpureocillium lilacinum TaxID=33203 RepID=A0ACC4D9N6_PURLI